ncbi:MAG: RHS repeat protein [Xanthomonadales bacterium]|nr:RHS repeat protein [Xanthomonadales bacterium]
MLTASDGNGQVTTHTYDPRGRKESTAISADDGGVAQTFAYDNHDDLVTHTDRRGIRALPLRPRASRHRYQRAGITQWTREPDAVGNVLAETDANGPRRPRPTTPRTSASAPRAAGRRADGPTADEPGRNADRCCRRGHADNKNTTNAISCSEHQRRQRNHHLHRRWRWSADDTHARWRDLDQHLRRRASPHRRRESAGVRNQLRLQRRRRAHRDHRWQQPRHHARRRQPGPHHPPHVSRRCGVRHHLRRNGNAVSDTTPEHSTTRSFDALNRLRTETAASITRTQSFDGNGNRLTASLGADTTRTQTCDPHNRPLSDHLQTANSDYALTATRDANGNRTQLRDARNVATTNTFDAHNRLIGSSAAEGATTNTWNADGTLARITQANGVETVYAYDGAKRITSITHRKNGIATLTFGYDYDARGNRIEETRTEAALPGQAARVQRSVHGYDRDDRLIASTVTYQPSNAQTPDTRTAWTLDDVGNRKTETVTELGTNTLRSNKTYTYNDRDQLERITDPANDLQIDYAYDDNGNRTRREVRSANVITSQVTYTFDARDRLIQAQPNAPNEAIVQYQYDADDRRIARIETPRVNGIPQTPITTRSIYDGSNLLHEADPAQITATYRRSAVLDRHIDHATNTVRHYQLDALRTRSP